MATISEKNKKIIVLLKQGKTQWEVHKMGYPFGTVRYHYQKLFQPKKFERFMKNHKERIKRKREENAKKELSTSKKR